MPNNGHGWSSEDVQDYGTTSFIDQIVEEMDPSLFDEPRSIANNPQVPPNEEFKDPVHNASPARVQNPPAIQISST